MAQTLRRSIFTLKLPAGYSDRLLLETPEYYIAGALVRHMNQIGERLGVEHDVIEKFVTFTIFSALNQSELLLSTRLYQILYSHGAGGIQAGTATKLNEALGVLIPSLNSVEKFIKSGLPHASTVAALPLVARELRQKALQTGTINPIFIHFIPDVIAALTTYLVTENSTAACVHKATRFVVRNLAKNTDLETYTEIVCAGLGVRVRVDQVRDALERAMRLKALNYRTILQAKKAPVLNGDYWVIFISDRIIFHAVKACFMVLREIGKGDEREADAESNPYKGITEHLSRDAINMREHHPIVFTQPVAWDREEGGRP